MSYPKPMPHPSTRVNPCPILNPSTTLSNTHILTQKLSHALTQALSTSLNVHLLHLQKWNHHWIFDLKLYHFWSVNLAVLNNWRMWRMWTMWNSHSSHFSFCLKSWTHLSGDLRSIPTTSMYRFLLSSLSTPFRRFVHLKNQILNHACSLLQNVLGSQRCLFW